MQWLSNKMTLSVCLVLVYRYNTRRCRVFLEVCLTEPLILPLSPVGEAERDEAISARTPMFALQRLSHIIHVLLLYLHKIKDGASILDLLYPHPSFE